MEIDIYQQCPCHSGKKIKFCCGKDIVSELSQIVAKCQSNQSLSALDQIERVTAKHGERDCLLTLQTHILFTLGETDKATASNEKFVARNPDHPIGRQHQAMSALASGDVITAISLLQDAMDLLKLDEIPLTFSNAFRLLGAVLLKSGHLIAARAHLQFALMVRGEANEEIVQLIHESFRAQGAPLILKTDFRLEQTPEGKEWAGKYQNVIRAMNRGQFRMALKILERIDQHWPDEKEVVRSLAIVHSILAQEEQMAAIWHRAGSLPTVTRWQAVEYEALSQIFLDEEPSGVLDMVAVDFEMADLDAVYGLASSSNRLIPSDTPETDPFGEGPPPRYSFFVLDRDQVEARDDLTAHDIPLVVGEVLLYGRQTDRDAQLVLLATKNDRYQETREFLSACFGDTVGREVDEAAISATSVAADTLAWNWHVPQGTSADQHRALIDEYRRHVLLERWPQIPFTCLDGTTPLEAKDRDDLQIPLEALVLNLEQSIALQMKGEQDVADLKQLLGIAKPEMLDATQLEDELLTPLRLRQIDPKTLSDEQLRKVYADSITIANTQVLRQIVPEILNREQLGQVIPREICFSMLAQMADDDAEALEHMNQARQEAKQAGRSIGLLLVQEFEVRLSRGLTDKLPELMQVIQKQHMSDPNVEFQLARVLNKFGLISPDGRTVSLPVPQAAEAAPESESGIWTPDSGEPSEVASGEGSGASKIWVPGDD